MEQFSGDRAVRRRALTWSALLGAGLATSAVAGGAAMVGEAGGGLPGVVVVAASLVGSLLVGMWAGSPAGRRAELPLRERWVAAGISFALAGAVATMWEVYAAMTITGIGTVLALLALVSAPAYSLGLIFPLILAWAERAVEHGDDPPRGEGALGELVVGGLGGLALTVAVVGLFIVPLVGAPPVFVAASVMLLFPLLYSEPEQGTIVEHVLREVQTPISTLRVTEVIHPGGRQPERRLYLDDEQESGELIRSGAPTLAYIAAAERWLTGDPVAGGRYLFLGGGAYTLPRRIAERDPAASITVVELDPTVTRLAYDYFGLRPDHRISTVTGDARAYLERTEGETFDRIYMDVYAGTEAVPYHLITRESFALLRAHLAPGGAIGMNLIGVTGAPEAVRMWSVVATAADVLSTIALYSHLGPDFPDLQNLMLLGSPDERRQFPDTLGVMERWPASDWNGAAAAPVLRDLYPTSGDPAAAEPSASHPGSAG